MPFGLGAGVCFHLPFSLTTTTRPGCCLLNRIELIRPPPPFPPGWQAKKIGRQKSRPTHRGSYTQLLRKSRLGWAFEAKPRSKLIHAIFCALPVSMNPAADRRPAQAFLQAVKRLRHPKAVKGGAVAFFGRKKWGRSVLVPTGPRGAKRGFSVT